MISNIFLMECIQNINGAWWERNTIPLSNVGSMLVRRLRRRPSIDPTLGKGIVCSVPLSSDPVAATVCYTRLVTSWL